MRPRISLSSQRLRRLRPDYICLPCQQKSLRRAFNSKNAYYEERRASTAEATTTDVRSGNHSNAAAAATDSSENSTATAEDAATDSSKKTYRPRRWHPKPERRTYLSMIQPTGIPHLGNYLGALRDWKSLQDEKSDPARGANHQLFFAISDLHSLTGNQDRKARAPAIRKTFASLLAVGLSPDHCSLFIQSRISYHTELMWILSTVASMGHLSRMTQWKSKSGLADAANLENISQKAREKLKLGLFSYPVLQAADILLYRPDFVPVGEDQIQHVEFTRNIARSFNAEYGKDFPTAERRVPIFVPPDHIVSPAKRIMSLTQPTHKMSKSAADASKSTISIIDPEHVIRGKIKAAVSDSIKGPITYDPAERPGVSNLLEILKHSSRSELTCEELAKEQADLPLGAFKSLVADAVIKELEGVSDRYYEVMDPKSKAIEDALEKGHQRAMHVSSRTMNLVRHVTGLQEAPSRSLKHLIGELRPHLGRKKSNSQHPEKKALEESEGASQAQI